MSNSKNATAITPTRQEDYPEWYQQVIKASELAEHSPVRGCMVIKPWGYTLWENMQRVLDSMFKATGHSNAYFPLFIPLSFFQKEAEHVDGFAKECAVVTHHQLKADANGTLVPSGELEEPLIVRPTSETIIGAMYAKWVQSYRDLPILINQWANVVRWEMRTRLFLRTMEFLWQEGHTAHATKEEAMLETMRILDIYTTFAQEYMSMPVIPGRKSENERFPGADESFTIEAMMQDRKALQAGTSHFLGQNFAKASGIKFQSVEGKEEFAWTTSWGVSTRLVGGLVMTHSDDDGLIIPPRISPLHVAILPVLHKEEHRTKVLEYCDLVATMLKLQQYDGKPVAVEIDRRQMQGGDKVWSWIKKGVPVLVEVGPRDVESNNVFVCLRYQGKRSSHSMPLETFVSSINKTLAEIQDALFRRALDFRMQNTITITTRQEFEEYFTPKNPEKPEIHGGFALCHFCGDREVEQRISNELGVTIRCYPLDQQEKEGTCIFTNKKTRNKALFAKSY